MDNFTAIPNEWFDHLADGRLTPPMYIIMTYLLRTCTWKTGVWRGEAMRICFDLNKEWSVSQINRYLTRLHACGYIIRPDATGRRGSYKIQINNYAHEEIVIRPTELIDWRDLGADDAHADAEVMRMSTQRSRRGDAEVMRSIPDVPDVLDVPDVPNVQSKEEEQQSSAAFKQEEKVK